MEAVDCIGEMESSLDRGFELTSTATSVGWHLERLLELEDRARSESQALLIPKGCGGRLS